MSHQNNSPYAIAVYDLMHRPGEMREKNLDIRVPEAFGNAVIGVRQDAPMKIDARLESLHDGILVSGEARTVITGECVRCLADIRKATRVEFQELFAYSEDEAFDYTVYDDYVDLEPVVRDAVVLSLPFQPVCQEDCTGLCPVWGAAARQSRPRARGSRRSTVGCPRRTRLPEPRLHRRKEIIMAVPKRKMSRASTRMRRAQWKATAPTLVKTIENGKTVYSLPHRAKVVEDSAGTPLYLEYKGRKVADV